MNLLNKRKLKDHHETLCLLIHSQGEIEAEIISDSIITSMQDGYLKADKENQAYYEAAHLIVFDEVTKELVREMKEIDDAYEYKKLLESGIGGALFQKKLAAAFSFVFGQLN